MASYHARSNSLPSRQHPISSQIDENLNRLRSSQSASTSSSIVQNLNGLQDLHEYVEMLLQLPQSQQALAQEQQRKCVEQLLDGSLMLLDVCSIAKDALLQTKEKSVKKAICKALKNLKNMENKDGENGDVISILRQVEAVTVNVLESLLSFISGPEAESKLSRWSKLMHQKRVTSAEDEIKNEIANAEATLRSFTKSENAKNVENVQNELQNSEECIQDLEQGLESLYRRLIKARVNVLNIVNC
ncbi:hypothetical protein COLO4_17956 [Corchorus olitorius]|uniref:Uncharacterized protein n=1 Tax=Corchorus olitorius TaxID=93759 RepID=A0A1R3JAZ6_9ROSI|nr:hypothetical protein COLO4_17956 [Corchorus olitorius]